MDAMWQRWHTALSRVGEVEQLGIKWEAAPGGTPPVPELVWRLRNVDEDLQRGFMDAIRSFRGNVRWELAAPDAGRGGINWAVVADAGHDRVADARRDFVTLLERVEAATA